MDVQTSKTKRTFAQLREKVLRDATAGSMANPLRISGAWLAGVTKAGSCMQLSVAQHYSASAFVTYGSLHVICVYYNVYDMRILLKMRQ